MASTWRHHLVIWRSPTRVLLKYGFCNKSFRKDETLTSWTLLKHNSPHFWAWLLLYSAIMPKSEGKYVVKLFNWLEVHLSELTCYKVHTLSEFELSQNLVYSAIFTILISIFFAQKLRIFDTHKNLFLNHKKWFLFS